MHPLDLTLDLAPMSSAETDQIVRETLADVTPRAATLALLRFGDYLELIRDAGVEPTPDLCAALFQELQAVCARDWSTEPVGADLNVD